MWTRLAADGRPGIFSSAVWVEYMTAPLGLRMAMGEVAICLFLTGRSLVQKWAVLPVSAMAVDVKWDGVGGPREEAVDEDNDAS